MRILLSGIPNNMTANQCSCRPSSAVTRRLLIFSSVILAMTPSTSSSSCTQIAGLVIYLVRHSRLQVFALAYSIQKIELVPTPTTLKWNRPPVVRCTCRKEAAEKDRDLPRLGLPQHTSIHNVSAFMNHTSLNGGDIWMDQLARPVPQLQAAIPRNAVTDRGRIFILEK